MLSVKIESKPKISLVELQQMSLYDLVQDDRRFTIFVNDIIFFTETIAICELAQYCQKWTKKTHTDFVYNTIESDENPLLAFRKRKDGWGIESVWRKFECFDVFSYEEVKGFVNKIISQVAE